MKKILDKINSLTIYDLIMMLFCILFIFAALVICISTWDKMQNAIFTRYSYELFGHRTVDHQLYFTVGKGMTRGYTPYVDLYENKPPMIFIVSALSYSLLGNFYLVNVLSFICMLTITLVPILFVILLFIFNKKKALFFNICLTLCVIAISVLITCYTQMRSANAQIEMIGTAFLSVYFLLIYFIDSKNAKFYSPLVIVSGFIFMISFMFKEPFGVLGLAGALLLVKNKKDLIYKFAMPVAYSIVFALLVFICTGTLIPYVTFYLRHMFGAHIGVHGSPFARMFNLAKVIDDINKGSKVLLLVIVICILLVGLKIVVFDHKEENSKKKKIIKISLRLVALIALIFATSFSIGVGGHYFPHHFAFGSPAYVLLFLIAIECVCNLSDCLFNYLKKQSENRDLSTNKRVLPYIFEIAMVCPLFLTLFGGYSFIKQTPNYLLREYVIKSNQNAMKENAKYLDTVLDILDEDTYQFVGFVGTVYNVYSETDHLPKGPIFATDMMNFEVLENNEIVDLFVQQVKEVNVIVRSIFYDTDYLCNLTEWFDEYLEENFTTESGNSKIDELNVPTDFELLYKIYYRCDFIK